MITRPPAQPLTSAGQRHLKGARHNNRDHHKLAAPSAIANVLDDNPEFLFTHWHPGVPATAALAQPGVEGPGATSC